MLQDASPAEQMQAIAMSVGVSPLLTYTDAYAENFLTCIIGDANLEAARLCRRGSRCHEDVLGVRGRIIAHPRRSSR